MRIAPDELNKLDQHAESLARSLYNNGIDFEIKTVVIRQNDSKQAHWVRFKVNGHAFLYKSGVLLDSDKGSQRTLGRNINYLSSLLVADKHLTKEHLRANNINVPRGEKFRRRNLKQALDYFEQRAYPLCVKPNNGRMGHCVTSSIVSFEQYKRALDYVAENYVNIVIEEHVEGEHFRFFYVEPNVIAIRQGIPLSVVGDGHRSISTLLDEKNQQRRKRNLVTHPTVEIDSHINHFLEAQGYSPSSVPAKNSRVFLRSSAGHSEAADTILIAPEEIHPDYLEIVAKACKSVPGLYYSGVDIVIKDKSQPASDDNYWLIELNANPGLSPYYYPWVGDKVDVCKNLINLISQKYPFS
ncbi:hypothetical protein [Amphritea pacifica]|uniref:hypothetical protein n=1 Tax=Amphritea pacifica TaxID=2811233 RepID=UPI00196488B7|nr:hypothetical protein [Amphritea pacifica]MBN1006412.1 hypothetical protein [Amphritea pacifica]